LNSLFVNHRSIRQLADAIDVKLLDTNGSTLGEVSEKWSIGTYMIPANTYKWKDSDTETVTLSAQLFVREDADPKMVEEITAALVKNADKIQGVHKAMKPLTTKLMADGKAIEYLGAPFCNASNSVNRQSFLIFAIEDIAKGRYYECESQTYSEWFTLKPADIQQNYEISEDKQTLLNKTLTTCEELHTSEELDLSCTFELVKNKPMMYLAFLNSNSMENNSINVNKTLLTPLCNVFEHLDTGAFFFIINVDEDEGLLYSCKIDQFSDWFDINSKMDDAKKKLSM
jgi:hypothetical protein